MHQIFIFVESTRSKYRSHKPMMNSYSHLQVVRQNCQEETTNFENPLWGRNLLWRVKISVENFKANRKSLDLQKQLMTLKSVPIFGRSKVTSFVVITMNVEFSSTCRRKNYSLFHWNTLILRGLLILIRTSCKKTHWQFLQCRFEQTLGEICSTEREASNGVHVVREETDEDSDDYQTRLIFARRLDGNWKSRSESRETGMDKGKT